MAKLPVLSGNNLIKILKKHGFEVKRQKGSHVVLKKDSLRLIVPLHPVLKKGTLLAILKQAELKREDLLH